MALLFHPRRRMRLPRGLVRLALVATLVACACARRSPAEDVVERSAERLEHALEMMRDADGNEQRLLVATMHYRAQHHAEILQLRRDGEALARLLRGDQRRDAEALVQTRVRPLLAQLQAEAQRFPRPDKALVFVRPLVLVTAPRPRADGKLPWLPDIPDLPPGLVAPTGVPDPATATAPHHGHNHP